MSLLADLNPWTVADKVIGLAGSVLDKIPDGNERVQAEKMLRMAVVAGASKWGPIGVSSTMTVAALCFYVMAVGFGFAELDVIVVGVLATIVSGFFGLKLKEGADFAKKLHEVDKKQRQS
jgi:hypothetical protein